MIELPKELMITKDDLAGAVYLDNLDCPLARALKRAGILISYENGYSVGGTEIVRHGDRRSESVGFYEWDTGEPFRVPREGRLVYILCDQLRSRAK